MSVTGVGLVERQTKLKQVERVVSSSVLHGSESLCRLLRYLAEQSLNHPGQLIKEYQIATEVFGRPADFDPRIDSTVRVQTGRLRAKLAEYYAQSGAADPWIVEIPKGSYALAFHARPSPAPQRPGPAVPPPAEPAKAIFGSRAVLALVLACVALFASLMANVFLFTNRSGVPAATPAEPPPPALAAFWKDFVNEPDEPWVVFSNAEFIGRPETGMHYFHAGTDRSDAILDHYTGVGEVLGIHELDRVFSELHRSVRVKRGRLLSLDDAKNNDLIFIGSPSENLSLRDIPTVTDFVFRRVADGPRRGDLQIVNTHPRVGEAATYISNPRIPLTDDYAVIGLMPGLNSSRWVLVLAGLTTIGTQAATEYVSRPTTVENLLTTLTGSHTGAVSPFEAVLHVRVSHGVPVQTDLAALHRR